jgi:hypothetical protein
MLKEAFDWIKDCVTSSYQPVPIRIPGDDTKCLLATHDGKLIEFPIPAKGKRLVVASLEDFNTLVGESLNNSEATFSKTVWYNAAGAIYFPDEPRRENAVELKLKMSYHYIALQKFRLTGPQVCGADPLTLNQERLVEFLRDDMAKVPADIIDCFSSIDWQQNERTALTVANASKSLDRDIAMRAVGSKDPLAKLPEMLSFVIKPYLNPELMHIEVRFDLRIRTNPGSRSFECWLDPQCAEQADYDLHDAVRDALETNLPDTASLALLSV